MKINIGYRVDKRIKVVEIRTGNTAFLVELEDFVLITGINEFEEATGVITLPIKDYSKLRKEELNHARPHSFRFRKAKNEG